MESLFIGGFESAQLGLNVYQRFCSFVFGRLFGLILGVDALEETALIDFLQYARINQVFYFDVADARILTFHETLQDLEPIHRNVRFTVFFQPDHREDILIGAFRGGGIA